MNDWCGEWKGGEKAVKEEVKYPHRRWSDLEGNEMKVEKVSFLWWNGGGWNTVVSRVRSGGGR